MTEALIEYCLVENDATISLSPVKDGKVYEPVLPENVTLGKTEVPLTFRSVSLLHVVLVKL